MAKRNSAREKVPSANGKALAELPEPLQRRLNAYALAAGAAGVAALACAQPAEGALVCKTLSIEIAGNYSVSLNPAGQALPPFQVAQTTYSYGSTFGQFWWNRGFLDPNSKAANVLLASNGYAANLPPGGLIGPGGKFGKGGSYGLLFSYGKGPRSSGKYGGGTKRKHRGNLNFGQSENYFGFKFSQGGKVHYGWVRVYATFSHQHYALGIRTISHLDEYGYENTPNTAIAAGSCSNAELNSTGSEGQPEVSRVEPPSPARQVASLGVLALGSEGLPFLRIRD